VLINNLVGVIHQGKFNDGYGSGGDRQLFELTAGKPTLKGNRSLSGVLLRPPSARNNPSHIHQGGAGSDQGDSDQQQVAAA